MHLQVNHTSKSRRKRGSSTILDEDLALKSTKLREDHSNLTSLPAYRHLSESESQAPLGDWPPSQARTLNGVSEHTAEQLQEPLGRSDSTNVRDGRAFKKKKAQQQDDFEDNSSLEDSQDQNLRLTLSLSPALSSNTLMEDDERVLTD